MISTMNQSPRGFAISSSILRYVGTALLAASTIIAQSKIIRPSGQSNSNSGKRTHVATLHSSDSSEGSRVAITSDQSLNDYEAYRRGDRFYVKIPAAEVPRAEALRGRGFGDVKSQRVGDSTVLSFRLQPGATAHVEQRGNKLDVVVAVPGGAPSVASNRARDLPRPNNIDSARNANAYKRGIPSTTGNTNRSARNNSPGNATPNNTNTRSRTENPNSLAGPLTNATPTLTPTPSPKASPTATASPTPRSSLVTSNSPSPSPSTVAAAPREDFWARMKERAHYWLLLAQLNPIPVAAGTLILLLIIALLLMQRRRAKSTRRVRSVTKSTAAGTTAASEAATTKGTSIPVEEAAAATAASIARSTPKDREDKSETTPITSASVPVAAATDDGRRERINRVADEAKKVLSGDPYDESLIGSDDQETRRLVGAELLSALVGRNAERRERARASFMKHGYFDDATRDLRTAGSENERAAAARRLSFVHDREATPHLIGALGDSSPDVRRAADEASLRSEEHTSELQSHSDLVCRLLLEKKK